MLKFIWQLIKISAVIFVVCIICEMIVAVLDLIVKYWFLILLTVILALSAFYFAADRSRRKGISKPAQHKNVPQPTQHMRALEYTDGSVTINTETELSEFMESHVLVRSFSTKVVGVTYNNDDGTSRQENLSCCLRGEPVGFHWHQFNGKPACAVISDHGQIGYLRENLAIDLDRNYGSDEYYMSGQITDITGGVDGMYYGCNITLSIYAPSN